MAILISVSLAVIAPTLLWGIPSNLDLINHFRFALPFYDAIVTGDIYPGWLAESNGGYGDPSFRFYPPALYYLLAAARFAIGNWYGATLVVFVLLSITSALGMYFWTRSILPAHQAAWASMFYSLAPYHLNQLYQAMLLAEWAASAVLPFVFGFLERVCERGRPRDIAGLGATFGILVFTHLPLTVIASIALVAYALVKLDGPNKLRKLAKLSLGAVLGLSVSAVYWVTMVTEVRWIGLNEIQHVASADYRHNFVLSTFSTENLSVWWMNITMLMTLLLFAPALPRITRMFTRTALRPAIALTALAVFMSVPLSRPIWALLEPLQETQFPWRWLILISMGGSILAAAGLPMILGGPNSKARVKRMLVFGAMAISIAFTFSHVIREAQYFPSQKFERVLTDLRGTPSVNYWFPIWSRPGIRPMATEVEVANRGVNVTLWEPEHRRFSVAAGPATEARIRTLYYPHWVAHSDSVTLPVRPDTDGALLVTIPENATTVELDFVEPQKTNFSTMSSLIGLIGIGALSLPFRRRAKQ
ncbi:MAG TPA: 6-pyruvoyl-tetrahydropterin synthase-related protein [Pyrinomonadaceae bacterium]|nr:6-pyruvoyl-tetrahydropterin synthase-related protein [Pyrinomonadaceae bacterium]